MNLEKYSALIKKTSLNYKFRKIDHAIKPDTLKKDSQNICFLIHDIDFSPKNAIEVASIEAAEGAVSTYTILLSGPHYNPFEKNTKEILREIKKFGHELGLHFDPTAHDIKNEKELDYFIAKEAEILSDLLDYDIKMFSFHNTTEFSMKCRSMTYGNLINAYSFFFQDSVQYTSDSNGYWRYRSWEQLLSEKHKIIKVLTHPEWWQSKTVSLPPLETIIKIGLRRYTRIISDYNENFSKQENRENKSTLSKLLKGLKNINDKEMLNAYALYAPLIKFLLSNSNSESKGNLEDIADDFLKERK